MVAVVTALVLLVPTNDEPAPSGTLAGAGAPGPTSAPLPVPSGTAPPLRLVPDHGLRSVEVALTRPRQLVEARSFSMVGLTWRGLPRPVRVSTRADGAWTPWTDLEVLTDGPDASSLERARRVTGTDLAWVGRADAVRVDVGAVVPEDLTLVLMEADAVPVIAPVAARPLVNRPALMRRRAWGADPSLRTGSPTMVRTVKQVHVHHTVNSNDYRRGDVPGLLRGIYRYHTQSLGWSDLGYNFLVDRFGRTWVGRAGGAGRPVQGAHTLGFNSTSTGVAVIGEYETKKPSARVLTALVHLSAWKLDQYGRDPDRRTWVRSEGSDRFAPGQRVRLPVIDGHRDTNETACPGVRLYRQLDDVRRRAGSRIDRRSGD